LTLISGSERRDRRRAVPSVASLRVLVAVGDGLTRAGLQALLETGADPGVCVVGAAGSGEAAIVAVHELAPDVVLMDAALAGCDELDVLRQIVADCGPDGVRVLLLMDAQSDEGVMRALRAGARGLLGKDAGPAELVRAVQAVAAGEALLGPSIARRLIDAILSRPERLDTRPERLEQLTDREREITSLVAWGLSNDEIAERLVISPATVRTHVSRAMLKVHAHDRAQLAALAYQSGLVTAGHDAAASAPAPRIASLAERRSAA
jgi:DNA-binding NarL/FixJ family response regulator